MRRRFLNSGGAVEPPVEPPIEGPTFEAYDITDLLMVGMQDNNYQYLPIGTIIFYDEYSGKLKAFIFSEEQHSVVTRGALDLTKGTYPVNDFMPIGILLYNGRLIDMDGPVVDPKRIVCMSLHTYTGASLYPVGLRDGKSEFNWSQSALKSLEFRSVGGEFLTDPYCVDETKLPSAGTTQGLLAPSNALSKTIDYMSPTSYPYHSSDMATPYSPDPYDEFEDRVCNYSMNTLGFASFCVKIPSPFEAVNLNMHYDPYINVYQAIGGYRNGGILIEEYNQFEGTEHGYTFVEGMKDAYNLDDVIFTIPSITELRMLWARMYEIALSENFIRKAGYPYQSILGTIHNLAIPITAYLYSCDHLSTDNTYNYVLGLKGRILKLPKTIELAKAYYNPLIIPLMHIPVSCFER